MVGIVEWNYDIPIVFKLLLSGNPRKCRSSIWDVPEEIALLGDYDEGTSYLFQFLGRISDPAVAPLREEAREFLQAEENKNRYFVLECGEIFEMTDKALVEQNDHLLAEIQNLGPAMEATLSTLAEAEKDKSKPVGFFAKLLGGKRAATKKKEDPTQVIDSLGLGNWSNTLFFDPSSE